MDKSKIPNAGLGAFLTYMGARKIRSNSENYKVCKDILSGCYFWEEQTMSHVFAVMPDGRTKGVLLTGENLHGNYNCVYWPRPLPMSKKAQIPCANSLAARSSTTLTVKVVGECLAVLKELEGRPNDGMGHLGMYKDDDYEHVSGVPYNQNFCFELDAQYAPLGPSGKCNMERILWHLSVHLTQSSRRPQNLYTSRHQVIYF